MTTLTSALNNAAPSVTTGRISNGNTTFFTKFAWSWMTPAEPPAHSANTL